MKIVKIELMLREDFHFNEMKFCDLKWKIFNNLAYNWTLLIAIDFYQKKNFCKISR